MKKKCFFTIMFPPLYFSCVKSHNSHMFLYLNGINPQIEHLNMFLNIWILILLREPGNKRSSRFDDSKSDTFVPGKSAQHFKMQSHFGIFDPEIG